jgi:hypothetical protein
LYGCELYLILMSKYKLQVPECRVVQYVLEVQTENYVSNVKDASLFIEATWYCQDSVIRAAGIN